MEEIPKNYRTVTIEQQPLLATNNSLAAFSMFDGKRSELSELVEAASSMRGDYIVILELFGKEAFQYIGYSEMGTMELLT